MKKNKGQTLVALLFFVLIGIMVTSVSTTLFFTNLRGDQASESSEILRQVADAGAEMALIKLLRNKNYSGESVVINNSNVTIEVVGGNTKTINVTSIDENNLEIKIQVIVNYANNVLNMISYKQI